MQYTSIILLAFVVVVTADLPLPVDIEDEAPQFLSSDDQEAYRLPEDLDPIHYDIEITPYFTATSTREAFTFDGTVTIRLKALKPNLSSLIIHENVRTISEVSLREASGEIVPVFSHERITDYHFLKVNLAEGVILQEGAEYDLTVVYIGNINETPLSRGVFRGNYVDKDGVTRWYLATHLQPVNSRQAFPSFDEPGFKSTFSIVINRPVGFAKSFSNMKLIDEETIGLTVRETFQKTPRMSAYLVSFHVSEGYIVIAENNDPEKPYRILARPEAIGQGEYALEVGPPLTEWFSKYFRIEYYDMEEDIKNDQLASPFWASGATENWGLVTYRELRLLYEEGETNALDKMYIGTITAHELAHKWFGNYITCRWWDNVWINEGFASYFEYFGMDGVYPELQMADQFNIMYVQSALSADSGTTTRALQHAVNSPAQVTAHFSGISYSKGASLLLMLKHLVSEDTFKNALHYFLDDRKYEHAFPSDLYNAFAKAVFEDGIPSYTFDITSFMKYWVEEQGYPVLNVAVNTETGRIDLEQQRFFQSASMTPTDQVWPLPLTYTTQNNPNWNNLQPFKVMTTKTDFIENAAGNGWVIFNVQQKAIYRVNYDVDNWQLLAKALSEDHTAIHHLNRAQIVDDVFALMRAEQMSYELGFKVLEFLKKDTSYYSWYPAISGFNWLRNRFLDLPESLEAFDNIIYEYLEAVINELGYDVDPNEHLTTTLNRFFILFFACNIGHKGCVENSEQKFTALVNNGVSVNPNLRRHVFCEGLRAGGIEEWQYLFNRHQQSNNQGDEMVMLRALGCTTNDEARKQYLENILNDDIVRAQDRVNAFVFFYTGDQSNARFALSFLKERIADIRTSVVLPAWFNNVIANVAGYLDEEGLKEMEEWLLASQEQIPEYAVGISAINSARANKQWGANNAAKIIAAAQGSTPEVTTPEVTTPEVTTPDPVTTASPGTTPDGGNSAISFIPTAVMLMWPALALLLK